MTDEAAFLALIKAEPACDLHRLVYADWLEEHGDPLRAEFIRNQVELATLTEPPLREDMGMSFMKPACPLCGKLTNQKCRWHHLLARGREILKAAKQGPGEGRWVCAALRTKFRNKVGFARGFVAEVECWGGDWVTWGDEVCEAHPIERVELSFPPALRTDATTGMTHRVRVSIQGRFKYLEYSEQDFARQRRPGELADDTVRRALRTALECLLELEWPGIRFTFTGSLTSFNTQLQLAGLPAIASYPG